jgi:hypothetical protein
MLPPELFQSGRQFLASFHGGILAPPEEKQKDGVGGK